MAKDDNQRLIDGQLPADPAADSEHVTSEKPEVILEEPLPLRLAEVLPSARELMYARAEGREKPISTPWREFNAQLGGGFWPGCHVLVGGTGTGKSAWALQLALHALQQGARVVYVNLELDQEQIALRLAGELAGVAWSKLYQPSPERHASKEELARVDEQLQLLAPLPLYLESAGATGWAPTRLSKIVERLRSEDPVGALLVVLDFLQIVGNEPDDRSELRERIGRTAYAARSIARTHKAVALLISSVARANYARVSDCEALADARLIATEAIKNAQKLLKDRFMLRTDALVGMGKESGEIEYAADSVTVAVSLSAEQPGAPTDVVFATAKQRAGRPGWSVLQFNGHRFSDTSDGGTRAYAKIREFSASQPTNRNRKRKANSATVVETDDARSDHCDERDAGDDRWE